jgi:hypothetical protein
MQAPAGCFIQDPVDVRTRVEIYSGLCTTQVVPGPRWTQRRNPGRPSYADMALIAIPSSLLLLILSKLPLHELSLLSWAGGRPSCAAIAPSTAACGDPAAAPLHAEFGEQTC